MIDALFGTWRGLVRLALSYAEVAAGRSFELPPADPAQIRRLVFVCHGNICRSAFADVVARGHGLNVASFGLSTSSGKGAHPPALEQARAMGHDLAAHRTTCLADHAPEPGDLLLAMEVRHLRRLAADERLSEVPRLLLGRFLRPPMPHLHDPYKLSPEFMAASLRRIERTIPALATAYPNAAACPPSP